MPDYRRLYVPGGSYFFTVHIRDQACRFDDALPRRLLRAAYHGCLERWPFTSEALVLLPGHLHAIWTMPERDPDFSRRWAWIKKEFTKAWREAMGPAWAKRQIWQPRFWERFIRHEDEFAAYADYLHYNPPHHALVDSPHQWRYSTFHRWVRLGYYPIDWGADGPPRRVASVSGAAGE